MVMVVMVMMVMMVVMVMMVMMVMIISIFVTIIAKANPLQVSGLLLQILALSSSSSLC